MFNPNSYIRVVIVEKFNDKTPENWFENKLNSIERILPLKSYVGYVFFFSNDKIIFYLNIETGYFGIIELEYKLLLHKYNLSYKQANVIMENILIKKYKLSKPSISVEYNSQNIIEEIEDEILNNIKNATK